MFHTRYKKPLTFPPVIVQLGPRTPVCPALPEPRESYQNQPSKANRIAREAWPRVGRQFMVDARKAFPVNPILVAREAKTGYGTGSLVPRGTLLRQRQRRAAVSARPFRNP